MADFERAFQKTMRNEGGFVLHEVKGDRGGMTFAGIARNFWPKWEGWLLLDAGDTENVALTNHVRAFYRVNFWDVIHGDELDDQRTADTLFDFAVNAGTRTAIKAMQIVVDATPDGIIGPKTLTALNAIPGDHFTAAYSLAKLARYAGIVNHDRSQSKFLLGWVNRTLKGAV